MISLLLVSHGELAKQLLTSARMIAGEGEALYAVGLFPGETPETFAEKLQPIYEEVGDQPLLILIDIFSGTPFNVTIKQIQRPNVECLTGMNLPMVVEAIVTREFTDVSELAANIRDAGLESIKNLKPLFTESNEVNNE